MKAISLVTVLAFLAIASPIAAAKLQADVADRGIDVVDVIKATATVQKIDLEKRKVTLLLEDGGHKTIKADKSIRNLDQVKVGDKLNLTYAEEIIVVVGSSKTAPSAAGAGMAAIAHKGSKPGGVMVETNSLTAKVVSIDAEKHKVTLLGPDGKKKTHKVSKKISLDKLKAGETVQIMVTDALAIEVVKGYFASRALQRSGEGVHGLSDSGQPQPSVRSRLPGVRCD